MSLSSTANSASGSTGGTRGDAPPGKVLKYTAYVFKNPVISEEDFHNHWRHHHSRNPIDGMKKHGVLRYTQYHCTAATRSLLEPMVAKRRDNPNTKLKFEIMPFDGIVQIWFPDWETWTRVSSEPIFAQAIFEDEAYLFDTSRSYVTLGWEEDMVLDKEVVMQPEYRGLDHCACTCKKCDGCSK
jgi:hypothetical protein